MQNKDVAGASVMAPRKGQTGRRQSPAAESSLTFSSHLLDVGSVCPQRAVAFGGGEPFLFGAV